MQRGKGNTAGAVQLHDASQCSQGSRACNDGTSMLTKKHCAEVKESCVDHQLRDSWRQAMPLVCRQHSAAQSHAQSQEPYPFCNLGIVGEHQLPVATPSMILLLRTVAKASHHSLPG